MSEITEQEKINAAIEAGGTDLSMAFQISTVEFLTYVQQAGYDMNTAMFMVSNALAKVMAWQITQAALVTRKEDAATEHQKYIQEKVETFKAPMEEMLKQAFKVLDEKLAEIKAAKDAEAEVRSKGDNVIPFPTHPGSSALN